jgi:hypothetical protein
MRKILLATASVLAFSLVSTGVMAWEGEHGHGGSGGIEENSIVAKTYQDQTVKTGGDIDVSGSKLKNNIGDIGGTGLFNVQQNNGNNAGQQAANTVSAIVGCDCASGVEENRMYAKTDQGAYVKNYGDVSTENSRLRNEIGSVSGTGLFNVQQNNGNNASQQAGNTLSAVVK